MADLHQPKRNPMRKKRKLCYDVKKESQRNQLFGKYTLVGLHVQHICPGHREIREIGDKQKEKKEKKDFALRDNFGRMN